MSVLSSDAHLGHPSSLSSPGPKDPALPQQREVRHWGNRLSSSSLGFSSPGTGRTLCEPTAPQTSLTPHSQSVKQKSHRPMQIKGPDTSVQETLRDKAE